MERLYAGQPPRSEVGHNVLSAEEGELLCVSVRQPPIGVGHDHCFSATLEARTYGRLLRFSHGWKLVEPLDARPKHIRVVGR